MTMTCKTCKWWGKEVQRDYLNFFVGMRICDCQFAARPGMLGVDHGQCDDPRSGEVATDAGFGCIHWEAKQ